MDSLWWGFELCPDRHFHHSLWWEFELSPDRHFHHSLWWEFELSPDRHFHHIPVLGAYHCSTLSHQLSWGQHLVPPMAYITYVEELDPVWHSFYNFYDGPVSAIDWPYTKSSYLRDEVSETSLSVKLLVTHLTSAHNYLFQHNLHRFL